MLFDPEEQLHLQDQLIDVNNHIANLKQAQDDKL